MFQKMYVSSRMFQKISGQVGPAKQKQRMAQLVK
jgi:hypothetical protein